MRTTLTLDDDVAVLLRRLLRTHGGSLKQLVNDALRKGLSHLSAPLPRRKRFTTKVYNAGECLVPSLDNIEEVLAIVEGEDRK